MDVGTPLEANSQATKLMQPGIGAFYYPPSDAQTTAVCGASPCDYRSDAALLQCRTMRIGIVSAIGLQRFGFALWAPGFACYRGDAIDQGKQLRDDDRVRCILEATATPRNSSYS